MSVATATISLVWVAVHGNLFGEMVRMGGELVAFVEGANVRGYRTDSGEAAWVKDDYGGGCFGIKMAANTRGKLRRVKWTNLYKDGTFNTLKNMEGGLRVRPRARMQERANEEAEKRVTQIRELQEGNGGTGTG